MQRLGIDEDTYLEVLGELTRLNPRPGSSLGEAVGKNFQQIIPDFLVETEDDGTVTLTLNNGNVPELRLSREFSEMLEEYTLNRENQSRDSKDAFLFLKQKVDAGAQHLVSQLFFDNEDFFRFVERCRIAGIDVPIEAGIMPVLSKASIQRMVSMCGASMPSKLTRILARYGDHPEALREAGIAYAIDQISDLIAGGVDGIHLYTMNNPAVARQISDSLSSIRKV